MRSLYPWDHGLATSFSDFLAIFLSNFISDVSFLDGSKHNKHHHGKHHKEKDLIKKGTVENKTPLHASLNVVPTADSTKRGIWDALNGANISVENHVHSYTSKYIGAPKQEKGSRRNIWDLINNSNISVENHVHSYSSRSDIGVQTNATRRNVWDMLKGANISIQNSVHSVSVKKFGADKKKSKDKVADIARKSLVLIPPVKMISKPADTMLLNKTKKNFLPMDMVDLVGNKRDEEPNEVAVQGKSPFDVAGKAFYLV